MQQLTNLHARHLAPLTEIGRLRGRLLELSKSWHLRGTLVLAPEGVDLCMTGPGPSIDALLAELRSRPGLESLTATLTPTQHQPFGRLRVFIQRDLSTLELAGISSDQQTKSLLPPQNLSVTTIHGMAATIASRHEFIRRATSPLPGSQPRDCFKSIKVRPDCDGKTVLAAACSAVGHLPESYWLSECAEYRILTVRHEPVTASTPVRAGEVYLHKFPNVTEPAINADVQILYEDEALIVVNKPAPLPMHAGGRFFRNTLQHILNAVYAPEQPRPAHRLDANTTGVLLITRSQRFAGRLQPQFSAGRIHKQYLVRVKGQPPQDSFYCDAPIGSDSRELGSRRVDFESGLPARTQFQVLRKYPDGTALLEANPMTGRTNQIRIHLWHLGLPICGDPVYLADGRLGTTQTLPTEAPPLNLHSWRIRFEHPLDGRPTEFTATPPKWARNDNER